VFESGEFDDLISALRTGEVFGEDMAKLKQRTGRRRASQQKGVSDVVRERVGLTQA
jgi:dishevelled associated activator of morphogenesis